MSCLDCKHWKKEGDASYGICSTLTYDIDVSPTRIEETEASKKRRRKSRYYATLVVRWKEADGPVPTLPERSVKELHLSLRTSSDHSCGLFVTKRRHLPVVKNPPLACYDRLLGEDIIDGTAP